MNERIVTGYESLADTALLAANKRTARQERGAVAAMLRQLAEIDRRKLYSRAGYSCMFYYCRGAVKLSESEAGRRVAVCRKARQFPRIFQMLDRGELNLATAYLLQPHLTANNHRSLLRQAAGMSKREVERLISSMAGRPERRDRIRFVAPPGAATTEKSVASPASQSPSADLPLLIAAASTPVPRTPASPTQDSPHPTPADAKSQQPRPASPRRVEMTFTASEEFLALFERAQRLLRHRYPDGRCERVLTDALRALLERVDPERALARKEARVRARKRVGAVRPAGKTRGPEAGASGSISRRIPQSVKDSVYRRDIGRCTYVAPGGERCAERGRLEYDHRIPFAAGGSSKDVGNIRLRCRAHNLLAARDFFGAERIEAAIGSRRAAAHEAAERAPRAP